MSKDIYYTKEQDNAFKEYFGGTTINDFWDGAVSAIGGSPSFDILKFEQFLIDKYGYDNTKLISISMFLESKFGEDCKDFVYSLLSNP